MFRYPITSLSTKEKETAQVLGYKYAMQGYKVGIMVASNSGRPAGSCGNGMFVQNIHSDHKPQEEDLVSCWMHASHPNNQTRQNALFARTIAQQWGLERPSGGQTTLAQFKVLTMFILSTRATMLSHVLLFMMHPCAPKGHADLI